jgi:hypothetical protein
VGVGGLALNGESVVCGVMLGFIVPQFREYSQTEESLLVEFPQIKDILIPGNSLWTLNLPEVMGH